MVPFRLLTMSLALGATIAPEVPMPEVSTTGHEAETEDLTSDELLVEEVSIDGMCGVY
jgi:mycofactocin precursor